MCQATSPAAGAIQPSTMPADTRLPLSRQPARLEIAEDSSRCRRRPAFVRLARRRRRCRHRSSTPLASGTVATVRCDDVERRVVACDDIPVGHKIAVHALAAGVRRAQVRRVHRPPDARRCGRGWVHDHNLVLTAVRDRRADERRLVRSARRRRSRPSATRASMSAAAWSSTRTTSGCGGSTPADARAAHGLDLSSGRHRTWTMRDGVEAIALASGHRLVVTAPAAVRLYDPLTGASTPLAEPAADLR